MQGKIVSISKRNKYIEISVNEAQKLRWSTEDKVILYTARVNDCFYVSDYQNSQEFLPLTPPLIYPDPNEVDYYKKQGKIKLSYSFEELSDLASSFTKRDVLQQNALTWWRKEIVLRTFRLLKVDLPSARRVAQLNGLNSLAGVREILLTNCLPYPFLSLETSSLLFSYTGRSIPSFMIAVLGLTRKIYENLSNGWVYTPQKDVARYLPGYSAYLPLLPQLNILREEDRFYYSEALKDEESLAKSLKAIAALPKYEPLEFPREKFSPQQAEALDICLREPLALISGYAGTGKTTIIAELVKLLPEAVIVSFTGKAVSRLKKVTGGNCLTIHKLLYSEFVPTEVIIDEASMVSLPLFVSLISKFSLRRLILIGDPFQLPPIEYGHVFEKLVSSGLFPSLALNKVFRTTENCILENTLALRENRLTDFIVGDNFTLIEGQTEAVLDLVRSLLPQKVTVVCPYTRPLKELNKGIQQIYSAGQTSSTDCYNNLYCVGDRVMCTENDYDKDVFNGEEGVVTSLTPATLRVEFASGTKEYNLEDEEDMNKIVLSYAISVHKSQGSEYETVIFYLENRQHGNFLNCRMVYTALTRAKERLYFVGSLAQLRASCSRSVNRTYDTIINRLK